MTQRKSLEPGAVRRVSVTLRAILASALLVTALARPAAAQVSLGCLDGQRLSEGDLARGTTIVVLWASWSPRSRDIVERVNALASRWGGSARVVTVSFQEDARAVEEFLAGKRMAAPVCLDSDGTFSRKYNLAHLPGLLVVKDGQPAYRGKLPDDPDRVIAGLLR